jgi:NitT/TauT family transport system permease protein
MKRVAYPLFFGLFVIFFWEIWANIREIPIWLLPTPTDIISGMTDYNNLILLWTHGKSTLTMAVTGFLMGAIVGITLAIISVYSETVEHVVTPFALALRTLPKIVIIPLLFIWYTHTLTAELIAVLLFSFYQVYYPFFIGLRNTDSDLINLMKIYKASPIQIITKVKIPNALVDLFTGLKLAIASSVIGATTAEMLGNGTGLGYLIVSSANELATVLTFCCIGAIIAISLALFGIICTIEKIFFQWHYKSCDKNERGEKR